MAGLGIAGAAAPVLSACTKSSGNDNDPAVEGDPVRIGLVIPQTGANRPLGDEINNGFLLYLKAKGNRFGNHRVELVTADEGETADSAKAAVDKLVGEKANAVVGIPNAVALSAARDSIENGHIPLITPSPSLPGLIGTKYIWRTGFVTDEPGRAAAKWIAEHVDHPVYVMAADGPSAREDSRAFVDALRAANGAAAGEPVI